MESPLFMVHGRLVLRVVIPLPLGRVLRYPHLAVVVEGEWILLEQHLAAEEAEGQPQWGQRQAIPQRVEMAAIRLSKVRHRVTVWVAEVARVAVVAEMAVMQNTEAAEAEAVMEVAHKPLKVAPQFSEAVVEAVDVAKFLQPTVAACGAVTHLEGRH